MDQNDFQLVNDQPVKRRAPDPPDVKPSQMVLFSGMDCMPGQLDLFDTDGTIDEE